MSDVPAMVLMAFDEASYRMRARPGAPGNGEKPGAGSTGVDGRRHASGAVAAVALLLGLLVAGCAAPSARPSTAPSSLAETSPAPATVDPAAASNATVSATSTTARTTAVRATSKPPPAWAAGTWKEGACKASSVQDPGHPDLAVLTMANGTRLTVLTWDGSSYRNASQEEGVRFLALSGSSIVTAEESEGRWTLSRRGRDLTPFALRNVAPVGALTTSGSSVYVVSKWNLTVLDGSLRESGRVPMEPPYPYSRLAKGLDGIDVHGGVAYVLDEAIPFWVFKASVQNPRAMNVLARLDLSVPNGGHFGQWLDAANGTWYIGARYVDGGIAGQTAFRVFANGTRGLSVPLASTPYGTVASTRPSEGYSVVPGAFLLPSWSILSRDGQADLARLSFHNGTPQRSCATPVWPGAQALHAASKSIAVAGGGHIGLFDTRGREVHRQPWPGNVAEVRVLP